MSAALKNYTKATILPTSAATFKPTPEQDRILTVASTTRENIIINALAGAAKTTTLKLLAKHLRQPGTCLAFNKKIAEELKKSFPGYVECSTLNSLGHRAWGRKFGGKLYLDAKKSFKILDETAKALKWSNSDLSEISGSLRKLYDLARNAGYTPRTGTHAKTPDLVGDKQDFLDSLNNAQDKPVSRQALEFLDTMINLGIDRGLEGYIDFTDQLYLSTLFGGEFPDPGRVVMADEVQDFSPLNHAMLRKICGTATRLIAVGDYRQSIYKFRGASTDSMERLQRDFKMTSLDLTVTFRCAQSIVENVRWHAPDMKYRANAPQGTVETLKVWGPNTIPTDGAFIICRNNAPLFRVAKKLIAAGLRVTIAGKDMLSSVKKIISEFGDYTLPTKTAKINLQRWAEEKRLTCRPENREALEDRIESINAILDWDTTIGGVIMRIDRISESEGRIILMSGHKSKGLEQDTVFHLDPQLIPSSYAVKAYDATGDGEILTQEDNLKYVIDTRAKNYLYYVTSEGFDPTI